MPDVTSDSQYLSFSVFNSKAGLTIGRQSLRNRLLQRLYEHSISNAVSTARSQNVITSPTEHALYPILRSIQDIRKVHKRLNSLLGLGICAPYLAYSTEMFVEKFISILKVDNEEIKSLYKRHVAFLRTFASEDKDHAKHNTYKAFQKWLMSKFPNGVPSSEDLEQVYQDEHLLNLMPPPQQLGQSSEYEYEFTSSVSDT
eukprot:Em0011g3a